MVRLRSATHERVACHIPLGQESAAKAAPDRSESISLTTLAVIEPGIGVARFDVPLRSASSSRIEQTGCHDTHSPAGLRWRPRR
jgi:hypothetical protein